MFKKLMFLVMIFSLVSAFAQDGEKSDDNSKYTIISSQIGYVVQTAEGLIVRYKIDRDYKTTYLPNKFFKDKIAVRIDENDTRVSPQMSIVLKDQKPYRVKLYLASNLSNMTYRYADLITDNVREKFKIEELDIEF